MFDKSVYSQRRKTLVAKMAQTAPEGSRGIALFVGNAESPAQYFDNGYKFRQDSTWIYFFGIDEPRFAAIIDLDSAKETIYADDVEIDDIIWMGPQPSVKSQAASVGVENSAPYSALDADVKKAIAAGRKVHFVSASRYYNAIKIGDLLGIHPSMTFRQGKNCCPAASEELSRAIISMRLVKDASEIASIEHACDLGQQMHTIARKGIQVGVIEQQICGDMEGLAQGKGWGLSFPTILTQHGEIFHCHSHEALIAPGKLLVIDAGVEANDHYASDFTRTYPTGGKFTSQQRDIYQTVCECNELAFNMVAPGVRYVDVHKSVAKHMLSNLSQLGLVHGDVDAMVAEGIAGLFMPHGLGHNMGLDVHDMEDYGENLVGYDDDQTRSPQLGLGSLRMARTLVPGNVVTDEPGIYFIPALIESWKKDGIGAEFINFDKLKEYYEFGGIRLEDDVLVTETGATRLGPNRLPITPDDVEAAMAADAENRK